MKKYLAPVGLAGLGVVSMLKFKTSQQPTLPAVPTTHYRSGETPANTKPRLTAVNTVPAVRPPQSLTPANTSTRTSAFDRPYTFFHQRLTYLNECLRVKNCSFPQTDPKSYEFSVYAEMESTLRTLKTWQRQHNYQDPRIPTLMLRFLAYEQSGIKIEALQVLNSQAPNEKILDSVLTNVIQHSHPEPVPFGMTELARYHSAEQRERIDDTLEQVLMQGGIFGAIEIAKNIKPLIDRDNRSRYVSVLRRLEKSPLTEDIHAALETSLKED